jgi:hypothetical protein
MSDILNLDELLGVQFLHYNSIRVTKYYKDGGN